MRLRDEIEEEAAMTQKPWAENVGTSFLGSGRLQKPDLERANSGKLDAASVKKAGDRTAAQEKDAGFSMDELRKLATGTCRIKWRAQAPTENAKSPSE